jgi:hypothetical protein
MQILRKQLMTRALFAGVCVILAVVVAVGYTMLYPPTTVRASSKYVSISVASSRVNAGELTDTGELSDWTIKFNPTGTHIKDGYLKIRLDFYPSEGSKCYDQYHVYVVDTTSAEYLAGYTGKVDKEGVPLDPVDYEKWLDGLPHIWQLNPALCHFLTVKPDITQVELDTIIKATFDADVVVTIDNIMIQEDSAHLISPYMRDKTVTSDAVSVDYITTADELASKDELDPEKDVDEQIDTYVKEKINTELASLTVVGTATDGTIEDVKAQSIDVGTAAIDRPSLAPGSYTWLVKENPANASGVIDTVQFRIATSGTGTVTVGTFTYAGSSGKYSTNDYEDLGTFGEGYSSVTGLNIDVLADDLLGSYTVHSFDRTDSGGYGVFYKTGNYVGQDNITYSTSSGRTLSLYATGTESGGGTPDIGNTPTSKDFGIVDPSTTYYAYGSAPSNPVADGECTFTVSNNSSAAIDLSVNGTNFTGGSTWYLGSGSPDATHCRVTVYCSGQNPASGVVLSTTPQSLYSNLADAATLKWDFKLETPSFDPTSSDSQKTMTITLIATLH